MVITEHDHINSDMPDSATFTLNLSGMHRLTEVLVRQRTALAPEDTHLLESLAHAFEVYYMLDDQRHPLGYTADTPKQQQQLARDREAKNNRLKNDSNSPIAGVCGYQEVQSAPYEHEVGRPVDREASFPRMTVVFKKPEHSARVRKLLGA